MNTPSRVLVVDDSIFHRHMIIRILEKYPQFQVIGEASNGGEAIKEVILKAPDAITLDLEMPGMDGFTFLRWLMFAKPTRTVVVSSRESNRSVFKALDLGALDFVVKPVSHDSYRLLDMERELVQKLTTAASASMEKVSLRLNQPQRKTRPARLGQEVARRPRVQAVLIAASTGGPPAIQTILQGLPDNFPVPICISQHMPSGFTSLFARRLATLTKLKVKEAEENDALGEGVFIAPGGNHLVLKENGSDVRLSVVPASEGDRYVPSADRMLLSGAQILGRRGVGIVLTGMGDDGMVGLSALKKAGGTVVAEDESTCVVYGMPRAAIEKGLADRVLPIQEIPEFLNSLALPSGSGGMQ